MSGYAVLVIQNGFYYVRDLNEIQDMRNELILAIVRTEYETQFVANEFYRSVGTRTISNKKAIRKFSDRATGKKPKTSKVAISIMIVVAVVGVLLRNE